MKQKEKFLKGIKDKVEEEQDYDRIVFKVLDEEKQQADAEREKQKAKIRKEWLREKRNEFDKKYSSNKT